MASTISENHYYGNSVHRLPTPHELINNTKSRRDIRQHLVHLLAIKPISKSDLRSRLRREGLNDHEQSSIPRILMDIALLRSDWYTLRAHMWNYVNENWPFYTEHERDQVKRNKPNQITSPQNKNYESSCGSGSSSTSTISPTQQTDTLEYEYQPPTKKVRISHMVAKATAHIHSSNKDYKHQVKDSKKINSACKDDIRHPQQQHAPQLDILAQSVQQTESRKREYQPPPRKTRIRPCNMIGYNMTNKINSEILRPEVNLPKNSESQRSPHSRSMKKDSTHKDLNEFQLSKKIGNISTPLSPETRKKQRMIELFGEDPVTLVKITTTDGKASQKMRTITDSNLQRQTQPQIDNLQKIENLTMPVSPPTRLRQRMLELFGDDPVTPVRSTRGHKTSYKRRRTKDSDLQPQLQLPKKSYNLETSTSPAPLNRQRMIIELFGEYSDDLD